MIPPQPSSRQKARKVNSLPQSPSRPLRNGSQKSPLYAARLSGKPSSGRPRPFKPRPRNRRPKPSRKATPDTDPQFIEDLTDWKVSKALEQRFGEQDQRQAIVKTIETFKGRVAQSFPDGEPDGMKAYRALQEVPVALQDIVLSSENGPKLAAHYGSNRAELERLSGLSPTMQAYEIAKTEARLSGPPSAPVKTVSTAPEPPGHMSRGAGGKFTVAADTDDFAAFEKAYGNG